MKDTLFVAKRLPSGHIALYVPGKPTVIVSNFSVVADVIEVVEPTKPIPNPAA